MPFIGSKVLAGILSYLAGGSGSSYVGFTQSGTGAVTRDSQGKMRDGEVSLKDFGAVCDDTTDDTAAFQAAVDAIGDISVIQRSGIKLIIPGPTLITGTITIRRKSIILEGRGWGYRTDTEARRSWIRWEGAAGSPMLKVQDCEGFTARNLRFIGLSTAKPSAAIEFNEENDGWSNNYNVLESIWIGPMPSETDDAEQFTNGILFAGTGITNSQNSFKNIRIVKAAVGIKVGSVQNLNISLDGFWPTSCSTAALHNAGRVRGNNWCFIANAIDIYHPETDQDAVAADPHTECFGYYSEAAGRMCEMAKTGALVLYGNAFQLTSSLNADGKVIKADGTNGPVRIHMTDIHWSRPTAPTTAPYLSLSPGSTGTREVVLDGMHVWGWMTGGPNLNGLDVATTAINSRVSVYFKEASSVAGYFPLSPAEVQLSGGTAKQWNPFHRDIVNNSAASFCDHFIGPGVDSSKWATAVGSDPQCAVGITVAQNGVLRLTTGDDAAANMAANGAQLHSALNWIDSSGWISCEVKVKLSAITNVAVYVGFTDQVAALEFPVTIGAADAFTAVATDFAGWVFDTAADTDNWFCTWSDPAAAGQNSTFAPSTGVYETLRVDIDPTGRIQFSRNGRIIHSQAAGVSAVALTPVVAAFSRTTLTRNIDVDFVMVQSNPI